MTAHIDWARKKFEIREALSSEDIEGLERATALVEAGLVPATQSERMLAFGKLAVILPMANIEPKLLKLRWDGYHRALIELPFDILEMACNDVTKTNIFFPKPAEILSAAEVYFQPRRMVLGRLRAFKKFEIVLNVPPQKESLHRRRAMAEGWRGKARAIGEYGQHDDQCV